MPSNKVANSKLSSKNENKPQEDGKITFYLTFCLATAAIGAGFQNGWSLGVFNTPSTVLENFYVECFARRGNPITESQLDTLWSITNGMLPLGGLFGGAANGFCADLLGRKRSLLAINVLVVLAAVMNVSARYLYWYELIIAAKLVSGVSIGLFSGISPLYLSELAPKKVRGAIGTLNQVMIVIGIVVTYTMGLPEILGSKDTWQWLLCVSLVPAVFCLLLVFAVESPKHLVNKQQLVEARATLMKLRGRDVASVDRELEELVREKDESMRQRAVKWSEFLTTKALRRPLIVTGVLQISNQLCGINAVIFYSQKIFADAGLKDSWPIYATILLGVVQVFMTLVCTVLIDRAGRKILLLTGMIGLSVSSFALACFRIISDNYPSDSVTWSNIATVIATLAYIVFFSIGPGAIPWLITSELFKSDSRAKASSIAVAINWLMNLSVVVGFIFIEQAIGSYSFFIFGTTSFFFALFILFFVPETKGKSIEEICKMFADKVIFFRSEEKKSSSSAVISSNQVAPARQHHQIRASQIEYSNEMRF